MKKAASGIAGAGALPGLLLILAGLLLALLGWLLLPAPSTPHPAPASDGDASGPVAAPLAAGTLRDPDGVPERLPHWQPDGVLPPDSPYRAGIRPTAALIRGRVVRRSVELWPRWVELRLENALDGSEAGRAQPTADAPGFRFEQLPFGMYRLHLEAEGCAPIHMQITASLGSPDQFLSLPLESAAGVAGIVRLRDGSPAASVPITVEPLPRSPRDSILALETRSDAQGGFKILGLTEGEYAVYPGPPRSPLGARVMVRIGPGAPEAWAALELPALGAARVVLEDLQRAGLAGVRVKAQRTRLREGETPYEEVREAGADGVLRFATLPYGEYAFTAWGGSFASVLREAHVAEGVEPEVRIPLRPDPRGLQPR